MSDSKRNKIGKTIIAKKNETDVFNPDHTYKEQKEKEYKQLKLFDLEVKENENDK